jgi:hypothetical protein
MYDAGSVAAVEYHESHFWMILIEVEKVCWGLGVGPNVKAIGDLFDDDIGRGPEREDGVFDGFDDFVAEYHFFLRIRI